MLQIVHASLETHMTYTAATFWVGYNCWQEFLSQTLWGSVFDHRPYLTLTLKDVPAAGLLALF